MFEVGKKYGGRAANQSSYWLCIAVDGCKAWLKPVNTEGTEGVYEFNGYWQEVPPEPERWSTWQNVYESDRATAQYLKRSYALEHPATGRNYDKRMAMLRRDFEQHEGKEAVCVNVELEKV